MVPKAISQEPARGVTANPVVSNMDGRIQLESRAAQIPSFYKIIEAAVDIDSNSMGF
jgi:hypothetical protein